MAELASLGYLHSALALSSVLPFAGSCCVFLLYHFQEVQLDGAHDCALYSLYLQSVYFVSAIH